MSNFSYVSSFMARESCLLANCFLLTPIHQWKKRIPCLLPHVFILLVWLSEYNAIWQRRDATEIMVFVHYFEVTVSWDSWVGAEGGRSSRLIDILKNRTNPITLCYISHAAKSWNRIYLVSDSLLGYRILAISKAKFMLSLLPMVFLIFCLKDVPI